MTQRLVLMTALLALFSSAVSSTRASESSWIFRPSTYTHDPATGDRVAQFAQEKPALVREDPTYEQSAYRHTRSGIRIGDTFDYLHIVETWGRGEDIRPYGEWLFPFRAGATPYGPWGNPQGPWTTPFGSWVNPYGLGRMPTPPWSPYYPWPYRPGAAPTPGTPPATTSPPSAPSPGAGADY